MKRRILIVEDETGIRENLREMLEAEGFAVSEADCGEDGIRQTLADPPHLVVCDVMMPGIDGFEVLAELRRREPTAHLPFLFLTARADRGSLRKGMELGAEDYLTKPFSRNELLAAVHTRLERAESLAASYRRQLGALRNTLARALPHELLTPLNGILGLSGILVQEYETVQRNEMLDLARGISDSGESLHFLVRRFLCYSEMEMAILDPELRSCLRASSCPEAPAILRKVTSHLPQLAITEQTTEIPAIVPEHLAVLLRELLPPRERFARVVVRASGGEWIVSLHKDAPEGFALPGRDDGSDLARAIISVAAQVYGARLERLPSGEGILSLPISETEKHA